MAGKPTIAQLLPSPMNCALDGRWKDGTKRGAALAACHGDPGSFACLIMLAGCGTPTPQPHFKIGQPYKINGTWYLRSRDPL